MEPKIGQSVRAKFSIIRNDSLQFDSGEIGYVAGAVTYILGGPLHYLVSKRDDYRDWYEYSAPELRRNFQILRK